MNIYLTKYNVKNVNMDELDNASFYESLFANIVKIPKACRRIDEQINHIAGVPYMSIMTTMEQFDAVIDLMNIKKELIKLYKTFVNWYDEQPDMIKKLYAAFYIKKDHDLCERLSHSSQHKVDRLISVLLNDFKVYLKVNSKLNKSELIKYPFVYNLYVNTHIKNKTKGKNKGECEYDDSADERRYHWRVRNRVVEEESK